MKHLAKIPLLAWIDSALGIATEPPDLFSRAAPIPEGVATFAIPDFLKPFVWLKAKLIDEVEALNNSDDSPNPFIELFNSSCNDPNCRECADYRQKTGEWKKKMFEVRLRLSYVNSLFHHTVEELFPELAGKDIQIHKGYIVSEKKRSKEKDGLAELLEELFSSPL